MLEETSGYLPFGKERVAQKYGAFTESRKYIGEEYDSGTGLSYLNARYYDGARGRFVGQDAVFWEIGQSGEGRVVLKNPQAQNSYSYAQNNPIVGKDPTGRYFEISGSFVGGGWAFSAGVRFDVNSGLDMFVSGGTGVGLHAGMEGMWSPGSVPNQRGATITVNSTVAKGVGGRVTQEVVNYDVTSRQGSIYPNTKQPSGGVVIGAGASVSAQEEITYPVFKSNPNSKTGQVVNLMSKKVANIKAQSTSKLNKLVSLLKSKSNQSSQQNKNKENL